MCWFLCVPSDKLVLFRKRDSIKKMPPHDWPIGKDIRHFLDKQLMLEGPEHYKWCLSLPDDPELYKS